MAILGYNTYDFVLCLDLYPYVPALVFVEILVALFITTSVIGFKLNRNQHVAEDTYNNTYNDYLTKPRITGTTNQNYAESEAPSDLDLYKSLANRGFDLRRFSDIDPEREIQDFENTISKKNNDYVYTY